MGPATWLMGFEESVTMPNDGEVVMVMGDLHRMSFTFANRETRRYLIDPLIRRLIRQTLTQSQRLVDRSPVPDVERRLGWSRLLMWKRERG
jgi:hypothetical protein